MKTKMRDVGHYNFCISLVEIGNTEAKAAVLPRKPDVDCEVCITLDGPVHGLATLQGRMI